MRRLVCLFLGGLLATASHAAVVFDQPHNGTGVLHKSSWYPPDGLDGDAYCWDSFSLGSNTAITEVHWRGGYELYPSGGQAPVYDFEVSIYRSSGGNNQPDMGTGGRLARWYVGGNASESPAGSFGGVAMYDYAFTLPSPFQAVAGVTYWLHVEASQNITYPYYAADWGFAVATGANNSHFRFITGGIYQTITNDLAFSLMASSAPTVNISASVNPAGAGTVSGTGAYPSGSIATLTATPNAGWGFVNWTEAGVPVSMNATYAFPATVDRTLVASFAPAYSITTFSSPPYGGTTTGGGVYNEGTTVVVSAVPAHGFLFDSWSDGSLEAAHSFPAASDLWITAFFRSAPDAVTFDFDAGPVSTSLPLDWTVNGVTGHLTGNFSVQQVGTVGISPAGFSGLCIWPNSVFPSDLVIDFSESLVDFSILVATADNVCDISSRMRVTVYNGSTLVGTSTVVPPQGSYPSATLTIAAPTGFDRAVVHWDAPGSVCQDYAPIFLADIVTVTRANPPTAVDHGAGELHPRLFTPRPNPFRNTTEIAFALPRAAEVRLRVFDLAGRLVRTLVSGVEAAGLRRLVWDGADDGGHQVRSGVYIVKLEGRGFHVDRRAVRVE
jgi:hypothetical protein